MKSNQHRIRCSALPSWPDCPRRTAAKTFRKLIERQGFKLRELPPSIGAAVGTATHKVAELVLQHKIDTGSLGAFDDGLEQALAGLSEEISPGAVWDDTTPNLNTAQLQVKSLAKAYYSAVAAKVDPLAVELSLEADAGGGFVLTGHIDLLTVQGWIRDLKTGSVERPYYQQHGGYSLLVRSNNQNGVVNGLAVDWIKRVGKTKPQPAPVEKIYDVQTCERAALDVIGDIKRCVSDFESVGNPGIFVANPMSMMCSDKYCPAWGTDFCPLSTAGKGGE